MTRRRPLQMAPLEDGYRYRELDWPRLTREADDLFRRLFPICRSLTGDGVRETLRELQSIAAFDVAEIPSGTRCYDWQVPDEWNICDAYVATAAGERVIDFRRSNLHVVGYSEPFDAEMPFDELDPHLHTLPAMPKAIPCSKAWRPSIPRRSCAEAAQPDALSSSSRAANEAYASFPP